MKNILRNITGITAGELNKVIGELYALTVGFKNISNATEQTPNDIKCIVKRVIDNYKTTVELEAFKGFIYGLQDNPENFNVLIDHFTDMTGEDYLINVKIPEGETYAPCSPIHKAHIEAQDAIQPLKKITKIELIHKPAVVGARAKVDDVYSIDAQAIVTDIDVLEAAELEIKNIETKFDVTADWASAGVTDEQSFISFLETTRGIRGNGFTNVIVNGFSLKGEKIECSLEAEGSFFDLTFMGITEARSFGDIKDLTVLQLNNNQIVDFNPSIALPTSLTRLSLDNNQIVSFNPSIALPTSMVVVDLSSNYMTLLGYEESEYWANNQPSFVNDCQFIFQSNPDSITSTNLEQILLTKNVIIS